MNTQDFEFDDKGDEVVKAVDALESETDELAEINDEPRVTQEEAEGFLAAVIKIIAAIFKH